MSRYVNCEEIEDANNIQIWCKVNGEVRQNETTADMVFPIQSLISFISQYMTLEPGDLILTGSPAGVGPIAPGDVIEAGIGKDLSMTFPVRSV